MLHRVQNLNSKCVTGILLLLAGLVLPFFLTESTFGIYRLIHTSVAARDSGVLVIAAFFLVLLNSLRALPIYVGTFLVGAGISGRKWIFPLLVPAIVWLEYAFIAIFHDISYDFGYPSFIVIVIIFVLSRLNLYNVTMFKHSVVLILVLIGVQLLDVLPGLTRYGFGRGAISMDIKTAASLIDRYDVLTVSSLAIMVFFLTTALLVSFLLSEQSKLLIAAKQVAEANLHSLQARRDAEIRSLVHDLKTPLTAIQGLAGVISILTPDEKLSDYAERIIHSVDSVSEMVSQISDGNKAAEISLDTLFDYIAFQIVSPEERGALTIDNAIPETKICVNKILFSRAMINLIHNAYSALDKLPKKIRIQVTSLPEGWVEIVVADNGCGISRDSLRKIWDIGYSEQGSTGLGLNFVKSIVEGCGGTIEMDSREGKGTTVRITIKEVI